MSDPPATAPASATIVPFGDSALLVTLGDEVDPLLSARVRVLADAVVATSATSAGTRVEFGRPTPGHATLVVPYDSLRYTAPAASAALRAIVDSTPAAAPPLPEPPSPGAAEIDIRVRYGGSDGPDLAAVADALGSTPDEVAQLHASVTYQVLLLGFAPGFAYLGMLPDALRLPRRSSPRARVPSGSVAIAGAQTAIYPGTMPGGWHLIGRTDARVWDATRDPPNLLVPGARVRFRAAQPDG